MAIIKCKMCGGELAIEAGVTVAECEYCGSRQTIPAADDEKKLKLFDRANRLRIGCDYDKAAGIYESIVADFPEEAEAYWGLILCKYGIEYVDDPATGNKIPTCHRSSFDSVMDDPNFEQVLECADVVARKVYREEAKHIEELRKGIIEVSGKEEPYDIFICYKETAPDGGRTLDSVLAQDVYDALTDKGYRVFFSRITLEDKLGREYEPYIFAALNSARVMLAFGTDYDYFNAVWVKNEWSRYLQLMTQDKTKYLIPCYKDVDPYDMPKEFAKLQAQDLGKVGATQDLLRGIEKIIPRQKAPEPVVQQVIQSGGPNTLALMKRGYSALEFGEWDEAFGYFDKILDMDAENVEAHVGQLLSELHLHEEAQLGRIKNVSFWENRHYIMACKYATGATRARLEGHVAEIRAEARRRAEEAERARREAEEAERRRAEAAAAARRQKEEAEQKAREEYLRRYRQGARIARDMVCARDCYTVALKQDGTSYVSLSIYKEARTWRDLSAIVCNSTGIYGLKQDGTAVVDAGSFFKKEWKQEMSTWRNIKKLITGRSMEAVAAIMTDGTARLVGMKKKEEPVKLWRNVVTGAICLDGFVGVRSDGTVLSTGLGKKETAEIAQWKNIVSVCGGFGSRIVGLRADGTVAITGVYGTSPTDGWQDITQVVCGDHHVIGLKKDGTVLGFGESGFSGWTDIVQVAAGKKHTLGLRKDGTVVAVGENKMGQCDVSDWKNVVAVYAGAEHSVGLKADGTLVAAGKNNLSQCSLSGWKLFENVTDLA